MQTNMTKLSTHEQQPVPELIRLSITDQEMMNRLSVEDISRDRPEVFDSLSSSDIRGFIYRCFSTKNESKGFQIIDSAIAHVSQSVAPWSEHTLQLLDSIVGTLAILSESNPRLKEILDNLFDHPNPLIVATAVNSLGHNSDFENFNRVCSLLVREEEPISRAAAEFVESCTRDAAFRRRRLVHVIDPGSEDFLRQALVPLERAYKKLKNEENSMPRTQKRVVNLVAMIYNEILDSTDWKRLNKEEIEERIYYALEQHLNEDIGPDALPSLFALLEVDKIEMGIRRSALNTIGRMTKNSACCHQVVAWLDKYEATETNVELQNIIEKVRIACNEGRSFSSIPEAPQKTRSNSIVPRSAGATLKTDKD
jgi:hypothetical protein